MKFRRVLASVAAVFALVAMLILPGIAVATEETERDPEQVTVLDQNTSEGDEKIVVVDDPQDETDDPSSPTDQTQSQELLDDDRDNETTTLDTDVVSSETPEESAEEAIEDAETAEVAAEATKTLSISYQGHVQDIGWQSEVKNGTVAGTTGRSLRVEGVKIWLSGDSSVRGGVEYRLHVQDKGWLGWSKDGALGGTTGQSLRAEAIQVRLYGDVASSYDVWYRVHVQDIGWMAWTSNGQLAGSEGKSLRMEAIQIRLVAKGTTPANLESSNVTYAYTSRTSSNLDGVGVRAHVQDIGWRAAVGNGSTAGTTGRSLRMEAFTIELADRSLAGQIQYRAHVQNEGWQSWRGEGAVAGTTGRSLRVEAFQIKLSDTALSRFDIYYRAHVEGVGWMAWAKNGETAGTVGLALRCEAMQVRLVPKGQKANLPGGDYRGAAVDATVTKPPKLSIKLVPQLQHGYKPLTYQRCIVMHDTTEYRPFDYWIDAWIKRGGSGTHFMVKEDGSIRQYADMNQICWHASGASYPSLNTKYNVVAYRSNSGSPMNQCSIGIEIDHVIDGRGYPKAQLDALDALVAYIDAYYGYPCTILQHKDYHTSNDDCSEQFQGYLRHLQQYRTTR